jgi:predicted DNA-binding protein
MPNLTIRLSEEKMNRLRQVATARRKSANALVAEAIDAYLPRLAGPSLADVLEDYVGAGGMGPETDSSRTGEALGEILDAKHRNGHL